MPVFFAMYSNQAWTFGSRSTGHGATASGQTMKSGEPRSFVARVVCSMISSTARPNFGSHLCVCGMAGLHERHPRERHPLLVEGLAEKRKRPGHEDEQSNGKLGGALLEARDALKEGAVHVRRGRRD